MFVSDIASKAVSGQVTFVFTQLELVFTIGNRLRAIKGNGSVENEGTEYVVRFAPQCKDGNPLAGLDDCDAVSIRLEGIEKQGAVWKAPVDPSRIDCHSAAPECLLRVDEWQRIAPRGSQRPFSRTLLPLYLDFPGHAVHSETGLARTATIMIGNWRLTFCNHGEYSEITAEGGRTDATEITEAALAVLQEKLGRPLPWVYREVHDKGERWITVRPKPTGAVSTPITTTVSSETFWQSFSEALYPYLDQVEGRGDNK